MRRMFSEKQVKELANQATQELKNQVEELEQDKPFAFVDIDVNNGNSLSITAYYNKKYIPFTLHLNRDTTNDVHINFVIYLSDNKIKFNYPRTNNYSLEDYAENTDEYQIKIDDVYEDEDGAYISVILEFSEGENHFVEADNEANIPLNNIMLMPFIHQ